ncbi:hypothetical protein SAMN02745165_00021 [Malonomonas rubra DSM 5091]|uniref:Uncharacterized protein n=1 Tax=Malonomonas rubra DSM 5091 TaxID=1122189 RepID=A0A1M6B2Z5_MALRU|nr:hypothetical protein SAMN02745165_00021 [Malonomonas rubra DSM 5091]
MIKIEDMMFFIKVSSKNIFKPFVKLTAVFLIHLKNRYSDMPPGTLILVAKQCSSVLLVTLLCLVMRRIMV